MAARLNSGNLEVIELQRVKGAELDAVLEDQVRAYRRCFGWDFTPSADLVRRFTNMESIAGCALRLDREVIGYSFYVLDEYRGLIGDLYVREEHQSPAFEFPLLQGMLDLLRYTPDLCRIESQFMLCGSLPVARWDGARPATAFPLSHFARGYQRLILRREIDSATRLAQSASNDGRFVFEKWSSRHLNEGGHLLEMAYRNHVDAEINDQYMTAGGCRRFLSNVVQYPGCGAFFPEGSYTAWDPDTGNMAGLCLASLVAPDAGHITQVCTAPWAQRIGLGAELVRRALLELALSGGRQATLSVTASNRKAMRLYERLGFTVIKEFTAYVWEGF
jgi:ribosomal protein S18 acetylase RimI-like enzyme